MNPIAQETTVQSWFRNYSRRLKLSFESSALVEHSTTKGSSRELQILDALEELLPTRFCVERGLVIVDSGGAQAPSFDGALVDRASWPSLFAGPGVRVAMIESVLAALEVKSRLDSDDLKDILEKAAKLRAMRRKSDGNASGPPFVMGFAYECANLNLSFFDFAVGFVSARELSPSLVCALNVGLCGLGKPIGGRTVPVPEPSAGSVPVLYRAGEDSLLVYLYFLSEWAGMEPNAARQFRLYSEELFSRMECFSFDSDFLQLLGAREECREQARQSFVGRPSQDIEELYRQARKDLGLPPSANHGCTGS
jgi:hypothetical protein